MLNCTMSLFSIFLTKKKSYFSFVFLQVVAIVFMLSCLVGCNYHCIESFPTAINSNPLWLRWLRGQRATQLHQPAALAAPVSLEYKQNPAQPNSNEGINSGHALLNFDSSSSSEGKEIATPTNQVALVSSVSAVGTQERGERRFEDRRFPGKESKH